jgi:hypothetical protein
MIKLREIHATPLSSLLDGVPLHHIRHVPHPSADRGKCPLF